VFSDEARSALSYKNKTAYFFKSKTGQVKTKTTFSRPRPLFLKTIKLLTQDHWLSQKFDWEGPKLENFCDVTLVTFSVT